MAWRSSLECARSLAAHVRTWTVKLPSINNHLTKPLAHKGGNRKHSRLLDRRDQREMRGFDCIRDCGFKILYEIKKITNCDLDVGLFVERERRG